MASAGGGVGNGVGGAGGRCGRGRGTGGLRGRLKALMSCRKLHNTLHWKCLALSVLMWANGTGIFWCEWNSSQVSVTKLTDSQFHIQHGKCGSSYIYVPVTFLIVLYVLQLIEAYHCQLRRDLRTKTGCERGRQLLDKYRAAYPIIWWRVICYHYAKRSRQTTSYRNGDAYVTTQDYYERVNTHTALAAFDFSTCGVEDRSSGVQGVRAALEKGSLIGVHFTKTFGFSNVEAENDYLLQRAKFFEENEAKDEYIETYEGMNLTDVEWQEDLTLFQEGSRLPWYMSQMCFWIATCCLLSWPYRLILTLKTTHVSCTVEKVFGTRYDNNPPPPPSNHVTSPRSPRHQGRNSPPGSPQPLTVNLPAFMSPINHHPQPGQDANNRGRENALCLSNEDENGSNADVAGVRTGATAEMLPSYSDVMLSERICQGQHREENSASQESSERPGESSNPSGGSIKCRSVSIQVDPTGTRTGSFSHLVEDDFLNVVACTHEGDESHQMPLPNVQLSPRYQRNRLYRIKCHSMSFQHNIQSNSLMHSSLQGEGQRSFVNKEEEERGLGGVKSFIRKSKSFVTPVHQLSPLCESLLSDSEC